jgi:hypothetical protein
VSSNRAVPGFREVEMEEVLACLWESLRDAGFASALVLLLAINKRDGNRRRNFTHGSE